MHHSCYSIFPIIQDLCDLGADIIHPIQALANEWDAPNLKKHFGGRVAFCGGVDAQNLLVKGRPFSGLMMVSNPSFAMIFTM